MSKRDRRDTRPAPQARTRSAGSDNPVRARSDLDTVQVSIVPRYQAPLVSTYEGMPTRQVPIKRPVQAKPVKPFQPSRIRFGYQDPNKVQKIAPRPDLTPCQAIARRREVLFATNRTGKGAHAPKVNFTNRSCK